MSERTNVAMTLPADVNQVDETGYVWAFLGDSAEPDRVMSGAIIVAGDAIEPFLARVVDVVDAPGGDSIVRLIRSCDATRSQCPGGGECPGSSLRLDRMSTASGY